MGARVREAAGVREATAGVDECRDRCREVGFGGCSASLWRVACSLIFATSLPSCCWPVRNCSTVCFNEAISCAMVSSDFVTSGGSAACVGGGSAAGVAGVGAAGVGVADAALLLS